MEGDRPSKEIYDVKKYNKIGKVYIFNITEFKYATRYKERHGSDKDAENLKQLFEKMGFKVKCHNNKTCSEFNEILDQIADKNFEDYGSLFMFFLSHGDDHGIMMTDVRFSREEILAKFRTNNVFTLGGKPKIFVFQACRGQQRESPVLVPQDGQEFIDAEGFTSSSQDEQIWEEGVKLTLPGGSDFLVCNAANKGFVSYRHEKNGSRYIQALVEVFEKYYEGQIGKEDDDLLRLLTWVSRQVAQSNYSVHKQMPAFNSTLTKLFYLPRKENSQNQVGIEHEATESEVAVHVSPSKRKPVHLTKTSEYTAKKRKNY